MSTVRVTQRLMVERSMDAMQIAKQRVSRVQEQLTTGRTINRPSDSPTGTNSAMRLREQLAATTQHARNASDGLAWLGRTDNTLTSMVEQSRRARDLILQGANSGALGPTAREAIATELEQIRASLVSLANTDHLGRPLFGGTTGAKQVYGEHPGPAPDPATGKIVFVADLPAAGAQAANDFTRRVGPGVDVRISTLGPEAFGTGTDNVFNVLQEAADTVRAGGDPSAQLTALDSRMKTMMTALADVGTRYGRVEQALVTAKDSELNVQAMLSEVENVDIARAAMDLQLQEVAYQSALAATARVIQPSLIDFLR